MYVLKIKKKKKRYCWIREYVQEVDKSRIETIFQYAEDFSDPVARNVVQLRFNDGRKVMTWEKIAKTLDITPREANLAYQRFVKKAKKDLLWNPTSNE